MVGLEWLEGQEAGASHVKDRDRRTIMKFCSGISPCKHKAATVRGMNCINLKFRN